MGFSFRNLTAATLAIGGLVALSGGAANAQTTLIAGAGAVPTPVAGPFGGTLQQTLSSAFSQTFNTTTISGTLISSVYSGGTGASGLDFYYQVRLDNGSPADTSVLAQLGISSFTGFTTAVAQSATGPAGSSFIAGTQTASSTAQRNASGNTIFFNFDTPNVPAGGLTTVMVVRTNATTFSAQGIGSPAGTVSTNTATLAPLAVASAPEPGTVALVGMGLMGTMGMVLRRRK